MRSIWILIGLTSLSSTATAGEPTVTIAAVEGWSTLFSGQTSSLSYQVRGDLPAGSRLVWSHAANRRVLERGERAMSPDDGQARVIQIEIRIPPVREGLVFDTQLRAKVVAPNGDVAAEHERTLRIFAHDPFANRRQWLEQMRIVLYDPQGDTAAIFDDLKIPFSPARSLSALNATSTGVVVVGEGTSLGMHSNLAGVLDDLVSQGRRVICLAPADGYLAFPGSDNSAIAPDRVALKRTDVITELDKRLDAIRWPPDGQVVRSALAVVSRRGRVVLSVDESPSAWPWVDVSYAGGGRMTICGFAIVRQWHASPTPRYLFAKLLELE